MKSAPCENYPYSEFIWSVFSRIHSQYGEILCISPYSLQKGENTDHKKSEYKHFKTNTLQKVLKVLVVLLILMMIFWSNYYSLGIKNVLKQKTHI